MADPPGWRSCYKVDSVTLVHGPKIQKDVQPGVRASENIGPVIEMWFHRPLAKTTAPVADGASGRPNHHPNPVRMRYEPRYTQAGSSAVERPDKHPGGRVVQLPPRLVLL